MSSATYLCDCLYHKNIDICGISEHWLYEKDLHFLNQIDNSYNYHAVADFDLKRPSKRRVGKGGVAILWHRRFDSFMYPLSLDDDRIIGVKLEMGTGLCIYFFQVYLPCANHPIEVFKEYFERLQNILYLYAEHGMVVLMGDFNTYLPEVSFRDRPDNRSICFQTFLQENNLFSVNTSELCTGANSTFVTYDGRHESLIDYILIPIEKYGFVSHCEILDDNVLNVSRHRPVSCSLSLSVQVPDACPSGPGSNVINWKKVDQNRINEYQNALTNSVHLNAIRQNNINSTGSIDQAYTVVIKEVTAAAYKSFPLKSFKRFLKPYWNEELRELHNIMKIYRHAWIRDNKPRNMNYTSYYDYKIAKRNFRRCHRKHADNYIQSQLNEIDRAAEVDSAHFWRLVNARRRTSNSSPGTEMIFHGQSFSTNIDINTEWARYFRDLYTPTQCDYFDSRFYDTVSQEVDHMKTGLEILLEPSSYPEISPEEVESAVKLAQCNKAGGDDGLCYEHIKYGGHMLFDILANLYTAIIRLAYSPKEMKKGVIVTLFKGGNKRKDNPDNYRAITLSSVLLKLLERILLTRIQLFDTIVPSIHSLQGGFKKQQGCVMTSFLVREAVQYAREKGSKVYACFLDVKKAFDQVWHEGLFFKLYKSGVNKAIVRTIINLYTDMESCVKSQSYKSDWFPVLQGTRQGGVLSPFLYLIFDNDLSWELEDSRLGLCVYNINCGSPAVADDKLVLSLSKLGLDRMLDICFRHSGRWRYEFQPPKCVVIVFNESPLDYRIMSRQWALGEATINENVLYKHLGIYMNKYLSLDDSIKEAASKLKGTFLSLVNSGIHEGGLNPISSKRIYKSVVIPKALYGCELWNSLLPKHVCILEKAHRFCVKFMQSLPRHTKTDVALILLNIRSIEYDIDYRKLIFFGQLCNLPHQYCVKEFFIHRLVDYKSNAGIVKGFLPDIYRILGKYSLLEPLNRFLSDGVFMSKQAWKHAVRENMKRDNDLQLQLKTENSESLQSVTRIAQVNKEFILWEISREYPKYLPFIQKAVRMLGFMLSRNWVQTCSNCQDGILSQSEHLLLYCSNTNEFREILWSRLIMRFGLTFFSTFMLESPKSQLELLFSGCSKLLNDKTDIVDCVKIFVTSLVKIHPPADYSIVI
ncbi:MAG: reverse transcriptase family protein [Candidatus Thiodiazotropha taylori]|nr:reverse transcriptase family protein [Candidatus Thiodiazotropha taylori]